MRAVALSLVLTAAACSRIAGIGGEFRVGDDDGDGGIDATLVDGQLDAYVPVLSAYLKASNPNNTDEFGYALAVSADGATIAVGASYEDSASNAINGIQTDNSAMEAGAVYVFQRTGTVWAQQAYLKASNSDLGDRFGFSVAMSDDGNTLLVGAPLEDSSGTGVGGANDNVAGNAGAVYVFVRTGSTWTLQRYIKASNSETGDNFGYFVALSSDGTTAVVGAPLEDSAALNVGGSQANGAVDSGAAYVFVHGADWTQQAYLKPSAVQTGHFGQSCAVSGDGNTIAVGGPFEASNATGIGGIATNTSAASAGAVHVYTRSGTVWTTQAYIKASNTDASDEFGWAVGLSGDGSVLAVGAPLEASAATGVGGNQTDDSAANAGAVYTFVRGGTTWTQQAYIKASNTDASDEFGVRLALTLDGTELLVGAIHEDSIATVVDGDEQDDTASSAGAAYLFAHGTTWQQQHYFKATNTQGGDQFGFVSARSTHVIGAQDEDSASAGIGGDQTNNVATDSGAVYVFE